FEPGGEAGPWLGLRTGVVLHNILDQKLDMTIGPDGETPIGQKIRAGAAIEAASASWAGFGPIVSGTVAAEFESDMGDFRANPVRCYGAEIRVLDLLSFRYGRVEDDAWDFEGVTRGAGVQVAIPGRGGVRLDWASVPLPLHGTDTEQTTVSVWMQPWR
ncbi:MAG: hypothetical protein QUU85_16285, partial [Candidatus Eisenbacteria bacterium]|nr:hypothetical protein [Candidatus Eisenbacteria bacterium]